MAKGSPLPIILLLGGAGVVAWFMTQKKEEPAPARKFPVETAGGTPPNPRSTAAPGPGYQGAGNMHAGEAAFRAAEALRVFQAQHGGMTPDQYTRAQQAAGDAAAKAAAAAQAARWAQPKAADYHPTGADSTTWGSGRPGSVIDPYGEDARANAAAALDRASTRPPEGGFIYKDASGACKVAMWAGDPDSNEAAAVPCFLRQDGCGDAGLEGGMWSMANIQAYVARKCAALEPGGWGR